MKKNILVTGAFGYLGQALSPYFRFNLPKGTLIHSDIKYSDSWLKLFQNKAGQFENLDITQNKELILLIDKEKINTILHLAHIDPLISEKNPPLSWEVNVNGTINLLNLCKEKGIKLFLILPSTQNEQIESIAKKTILSLANYYMSKYQAEIYLILTPYLLGHSLPNSHLLFYWLESIKSIYQKNLPIKSPCSPKLSIPILSIEEFANLLTSLLNQKSLPSKRLRMPYFSTSFEEFLKLVQDPVEIIHEANPLYEKLLSNTFLPNFESFTKIKESPSYDAKKLIQELEKVFLKP